MSTIAGPEVFHVQSYLNDRTANPNFVMVELGYGHCPVIGIQQSLFKGDQAYIGIEAGMRTLPRHLAAQNERLHKQYAGKNVFFMTHNIGEGSIVLPDPQSDDEAYVGEYQTRTLLPDNAADEVFASNMFCDPLIARDFGRTYSLLQEVARLVHHTGMIVLRETITPWEVGGITTETTRPLGLREVARVSPNQTEEWKALELVYGCEYDSKPYPQSYYLFLAKQSIR